MMRFEEDKVWFYLMNAELEVFRIGLPYEVAHECWRWSNLGEPPMSDDDLKTWMANTFLRFIPLINDRTQYVSRAGGKDDYRVGVTAISNTSMLYKAALLDRQAKVASQEGDTHHPFVPEVRFAFRVGEINDPKDGRDLRPEKAPFHSVQ